MLLGLKLEVLGVLVGHIPPNPHLAELLWQKQQEVMVKQPGYVGYVGATQPHFRLQPVAHSRDSGSPYGKGNTLMVIYR